MKKVLTKFTLRSVLISLGMLALGVLILINETNILQWIIIALGIVLIVDGIIRFIQFILQSPEDKKTFNFDIVRAIIEAIVGIVVIIYSGSMLNALCVFIGIIIVVEGILHLQFVLTKRNTVASWLFNFAIALINILIGIYIIVHPFLVKDVLNILIGVEIILASVFGLVSYIYLFIALRKAPDDLSIEVVEIEEVSSDSRELSEEETTSEQVSE